MQSFVQIIDTIMVGQLGPEEIAAIGLGNSLRLFVFILVLSVAVGSMTLVAQAKGARDHARISFITRQSISSGLLVSIILGIIGILLAKPALGLMEQGGNQEVVDLAYKYLVIVFIGTPLLLLNFVVERVMQGAGDMKTPLFLNVITIVLNVFLNYVFIFGLGAVPAMGVIGAALGTVIARGLSLAVGIYIFYSGKNVVQILPGTYRPDWSMFRDIFRIGVPSGIQGILRRGANIFLIGLITATELGTFGAAALTIGWQMEQLIIQPIVGLNIAGTSFIGQLLGRWQVKDALSYGNIMIVLGVIICTIFTIPIFTNPVKVIGLFDPSMDPLVMKGALGFFKISLLSLPIAAIAVVITGIMRGAGDTKPAMYSTLAFRNVFTIVFAYFLAFTMDMGSYGIWWAILAGRALDSLTLSIIWVRKRWLNTAIALTDIYRTHLNKMDDSTLEDFLSQVRTPLMGEKGTMEIIDTDRVTYRSNGVDRVYVFNDLGYSAV